MTLAVYRRPFDFEGRDALVTVRARMDGLYSELVLDGRIVAEDSTPLKGEEAIRNHRLAARLPDGRVLEVEGGYIDWTRIAIAARIDGVLVHESHPGKAIAYPARAAAMIRKQSEGGDAGYDLEAFKRNRVPIAVDIGLGLLFYAVAKLTDLTTAALVGAVVGIGLVVLQRFIKTDIIGGLALFGVVMLLISAGLALAFQDDMAVKMRTTIVGLISAAFFLSDGFFLKGGRLGKGLMRYLPFSDIDPARLAIGMGAVGLIMAALNYGVAKVASTDFWLFYTTFLDFVLVMVLVIGVFKYARTGTPKLIQTPN